MKACNRSESRKCMKKKTTKLNKYVENKLPSTSTNRTIMSENIQLNGTEKKKENKKTNKFPIEFACNSKLIPTDFSS